MVDWLFMYVVFMCFSLTVFGALLVYFVVFGLVDCGILLFEVYLFV